MFRALVLEVRKSFTATIPFLCGFPPPKACPFQSSVARNLNMNDQGKKCTSLLKGRQHSPKYPID